MNLIDQQNSLVIDITYECNAKCRYCRWSKNKKSAKPIQSREYIYISEDIINHLQTQRVVLSGGEPLLKNDLAEIIMHYKNMNIPSIIIITNGFLLTQSRLESLVNAGLTGIAFSIDSFDPNTAFKARAYDQKQIENVKSNVTFALLLKEGYNLEIGINVVISTANIQNKQLEKLVYFTNNFQLDWIKFQPIYDNGYIGINARDLLLSSFDSELIRATGKNIAIISKAETNPITFWNNLADTLNEKKLSNKSCGLSIRQAISQNNGIKICPWINSPKYDFKNKTFTETQEEFLIARNRCKVELFCFCLQELSHKWELEKI